MMVILYFLLLLGLGIYSYSQIDLNLTLLQTPWFLGFQHTMIQLGYFNRPLSTLIFLIITLLLFAFYILFFKNPPKKYVLLICGIILFGLLSYPAFSHDVFNYIFDARIFVVHHANPYTSTALMFPDDTWTRFMNWTHRTYPYGPVFLPISIAVYLLGAHKFILTLTLFKTLMVAAYVGSIYYIYKISGKKGAILFALNPLIIYEAVISSHLDILMLFFALLGFYSRNFWSLLFSIGIKYTTILFLPIIYWPKISKSWQLKLLILAAYFGAIVQVGFREILPHYFIIPLGFSALLPENKYFLWGGIILSLVLILFRYPFFLLYGQWPRL